MTNYEIIKECVQMNAKTSESEIINKLIEEGIGNGHKETIKTVETEEAAVKELKKYKCTSRIVSTYASKVRECECYYAVRTKDGEWSDDFEFATIETAE